MMACHRVFKTFRSLISVHFVDFGLPLRQVNITWDIDHGDFVTDDVDINDGVSTITNLNGLTCTVTYTLMIHPAARTGVACV